LAFSNTKCLLWIFFSGIFENFDDRGEASLRLTKRQCRKCTEPTAGMEKSRELPEN